MLDQTQNSRRSYRQQCGCCRKHQTCRYRHFSPHSLNFLINCGEVEEEAIRRPVCDECYRDIRDVLIDRADELESSFELTTRVLTEAPLERMRIA